MKNLIKAQEYAKGNMLRNNSYSSSFDATKLAGYINLVELTIAEIVGQPMFDDMIAVRNTSDYNYEASTPVLLFPNNPNYETIFQKFIFYALGFEMTATAISFLNVEVGNPGVNAFETMGIKKPERTERLSALDSNKSAAMRYRNLLKDYLCANQSDYPLLPTDLCISGCGCSGTNVAPKREYNFSFSPPSY